MQTVTKKKKMSRKTILFILFCCTLPVVNFFVFYVYTNISSIFMAFRDSSGNVSLDNFVRFFEEFKSDTTQLPIAFKNTFITFGIAFVAFPFRVMVSYFIYRKIPFYKFYRHVFFIPTIIFSVAVAMVFSQLVSVEGFIAKWVADISGLEYTPELLADSRFANYVIWAKMLWLGFPGNLIIWGGTFARIPDDVLESGKIDGTNWWTEFTKIVVPLVWPTVSLHLILSFCGIFNASGSVYLLTRGEYGTETLTSWLYKMTRAGAGAAYESNVFNYMSAVGLILTVVAIALSFSIRRFTDKAFSDVEF